MKIVVGIGCSILTLFIAGSACAAPAMAGPKKGPGRLYLGGSVVSAQVNESDDIADFEFDTDDLGYKIFAGYRLGASSGLNLAVEGSYVDFGQVTTPDGVTQDIGDTAWDLYGVASLRFGSFGIFGKVGSAWWSGEIDDFQDAMDDFGDTMAYGAGLEFSANTFALRAEYERFDFDAANIDFVSIGASLSF